MHEAIVPETPYVLIDTEKMEKNIAGMAHLAKNDGVDLRPHIKTHKIPAIAHKQVQAGATGISVATVSEAEVMAEHGLDDIFIAYPIVTDSKIKRAIQLGQTIHLKVGVDSLAGAQRLSKMAASNDHTLHVRLEVDTGLRRTGVLYEDAVKLAYDISQLPNIHLDGIYTFRGPILGDGPTLDREKAGLEEGQLMVSLAEQMRAQGIKITDISVGSTPTTPYASKVKGITEVRPGTYVFNDQMQTQMGTCSIDQCAATVIVTVVSRPSPELVIIDGGSKTFATDVQPNTHPLQLKGFGHVLNEPHVLFERLTEEHGMLKVHKDDPFQIGDQLEIIPNHVCSTVNLHNQVWMKTENGINKEPVLARGKVE